MKNPLPKTLRIFNLAVAGLFLSAVFLLICILFLYPIKEDWCWQPAAWPWQMVRHDVVMSPEELKHWQENGGWSGYTAIGNQYSNACEREFNFFEVILYSIFPKTKQEWDQNKKQELAHLIFQSHQQEIRVAFGDPQLEVTLRNIVDQNDHPSPDYYKQPFSYFYQTSNGYLIESDGFLGKIKNIQCENCDLSHHQTLSAAELENIYINFIQRIEPIFTQNHWLETWERYTIEQKDDRTSFRLNHKQYKLADGQTPAFIQIDLDAAGNLLNYTSDFRH